MRIFEGIYLLFVFKFLGIAQARTNPFLSSPYFPTNMYTSLSVLSAINNNSTIYSQTYPLPFNSTPNAFISITSMSWINNINITLDVISLNSTALTLQILNDTSLTAMSINILAMDSTQYPYTSSVFQFTAPSSYSSVIQTINIANHQNYLLSFLTQYILQKNATASTGSPTVSTGSPTALSTQVSPSINLTSLTITYNITQVIIQSLRLSLINFNPANFLYPTSSSSTAQKYYLITSNGVISSPSQTANFIQYYSNIYFGGVQILYGIDFTSSTNRINIMLSNTNNSAENYYVSEFLLLMNECPLLFPNTDVNRTLCYDNCGAGFYSDHQFICHPCNSNCLTCSGTATTCTSCNSPYAILYGHVCGCPTNSIQVTASNGSITCRLCSSYMAYCFSCTSATVCTSCYTNLALITSTNPMQCLCVGGYALAVYSGVPRCLYPVTSNEACKNGYTLKSGMCTCDPADGVSLVNGACI